MSALRAAALTVALLPLAGWAETISAVLEPVQQAELRPALNSPIADLPATEGAQVSKDSLLVQLDARYQQARVALARTAREATGQLTRAQAQVAQAEALVGRIERAAARGAARPWEVEQARQALAIAQADLDVVRDSQAQAAAQLALEEAQLRSYEIRAPFDGTVLKIHQSLGDMATPQNPVLDLGDLSVLSVTGFVPAATAARLAPGDTLTAAPEEGGAPLRLTLHSIDPRIDPVSQTVRVVLHLPNPERGLRAGATVLIDLP